MNTWREIRDVKRDTTTTRIAIREVNTSENYISGEDAFGGVVQISLDFRDSVLTIPQVGELWIVERTGNDWRLGKKLDTTQIKPLNELSPGDKRLEAANDLHLLAKNRIFIGDSTAQSGSSLVTTNGSGRADIVYPVAFPTSTQIVVATNGDGALASFWIDIFSTSKTGFNFRATTAVGFFVGSCRINWYAIGS